MDKTSVLFQLILTIALTLRSCPSSGGMRLCPQLTSSCCSIWAAWRKLWSRARGSCKSREGRKAEKNWSDTQRHWQALCPYMRVPEATIYQYLCVLQMANKELSELQSELETLEDNNKQVELKLDMEQGLCREKVGRLVAWNAFASKRYKWKHCYLYCFLGKRNGKLAHGHRQPCRPVLPSSIWASRRHGHNDNVGHGQGEQMI